MSINQSMHFKECTPEKTVARLKGILRSIGVEVQELEKRVSEIGTHSVRVVFKGTTFGTNGKGISEEYCMASAYAEFFERYQNDITPCWKTERKSKYSFKFAFDERILTGAEIVSDDNSFMQFYFSKRNLENASFEQKVEAFESVQKADFWLYDLENKYVSLPFYSVRDDEVHYLPRIAYSFYYGSNGMCAGNTPEEALVQGLSEIIERVAQRRIFLEKPTLPDVPDEYIKKFPYVYELLRKTRENQDFICYMKDCSFGGKYPVAGLVILEKNTGKIGVKLGCHPDYGIAMERAFTEAAQGSNIYDFVNRSFVDFHNFNVDSDSNISNCFKMSFAQFPYQLIGPTPTYSFTPAKDVSQLSNTELLKAWVKQIMAEGYDILIRDVSAFGFPSFHIIIPGISEFQDTDDLRFKAINTKMFCQKMFERPEEINRNNIIYILTTLKYFHHDLIENDPSQYFAAGNTYKYPGEEIAFSYGYLFAMCCAIAEDWKSAEKIASEMYQAAIKKNISADKIKFYLCLLYYFSSMDELHSHKLSIEYLSVMFSQEVVNKIDCLFKDKTTILSKQYPCHPLSAEKNDNPYNVVFNIREKLLEAQVASKIDQLQLRNLFIDKRV